MLTIVAEPVLISEEQKLVVTANETGDFSWITLNLAVESC
jgi:hypothetical protein